MVVLEGGDVSYEQGIPVEQGLVPVSKSCLCFKKVSLVWAGAAAQKAVGGATGVPHLQEGPLP